MYGGYSSGSSHHSSSTYGRYTSASQAQAQAEAEAARRRQQQQSTSTASNGVNPGMTKAELIVPADAFPGKQVRIRVQGRDYMIVIPPNARPGQRIMIQVPIPNDPIPAATPYQQFPAPPPPPPQPLYAPPPPPQPQYATPQPSPPQAQYGAPPSQSYQSNPQYSVSNSFGSSTSLPNYSYSAQQYASLTVPSAKHGTHHQTYPSVPSSTHSAAVPPASNGGGDVVYTTPPAYNPSAAASGGTSYDSSSPSKPYNPATDQGTLASKTSSSSISDAGKKVFQQAVSASTQLVVVTNHLVGEDQRESYAEHNIISVYEGETVTLVEGDLSAGLPPPYEDYINVRTDDGRVGKVAKVALMIKS